MHKIAISVMAGLAVFGTATLASAQGQDRGKGQGRGAAPPHAAPTPRAAPPARPAPQVNRAPRAPEMRQQAAPRPNIQRAPQNADRGRNRVVQERQQRVERPRAEKRAAQPSPRKLEQRPNDQRAAQPKIEQRRNEQRAAQPKLDQPRAFRPDQKAPDRPLAGRTDKKGDNAQLARHEQVRQERQKLSVEQRTRLRGAFNINRGPHITNVRFATRVGTRIPRSVRLLAVPAAVFAVFPYYRDYQYVTVDDTICIVDPATYEIVDVIDDGPYAPPANRPLNAQLSLTPAQSAMVLDSVPPSFPEADVQLRLALGAEIPAGIELHEFAPLVLGEAPALRDFRFLVAQGDMVIVDPRDRSIALVLDR
jgi:Protein of unknown function (DUF1236)